MQIDNNTLIDELIALTEKSSVVARTFRALPAEILNFKPDAKSWSILECLEHLNRYGTFYLPELEKSIAQHKDTSKPPPLFKSGTFGNYFANLMKVKNGRIVRMKTPADKNPAGSQLSVDTIDAFLAQQERLVSLLNSARTVNLVKARVPLTISPFLRLRLGDTFRFYVNHIERHVWQAENTLAVAQRRKA